MIQPGAKSHKISAALRPYPSKLFVETTTRCNLNCFMCVKQSGECCFEEGDIRPETFLRITPALKHAKVLILNGVGEPLLHPKLEYFVREARKHMPEGSWIGFQSNGLLLNGARAKSLLEAGLDCICLSIDSLEPERFREMRSGGEVTNIDSALNNLGGARELHGRSGFKIGIEFVVMRNNLKELPGAIEWAAKRGVSFVLVTHVLPYEQEHIEQSAYSLCTEQSINYFLDCKSAAEKAGVDIKQYPKVIWKFHKDDEDKKIIQYVEDMKAEAQKNGVFLDLKKLFAIDMEWLGQVKKTFTEAKAVANLYGLELSLPEITLRDDRKCEFVDDGSLFVSWNGDVHPCYFLWHGYQCFASGWRQAVQPKIFGNVNNKPALDIWNSEDFSQFRKNVTTYDYPYCSSCGLAPCDYVQTESFEQDCHIKEEPCGSCLWCMGIFKCLS